MAAVEINRSILTPHLLCTMYWVYILRSLSHADTIYIGSTNDLEERVQQHNAGRSPSTKRYLPWALVYCEGYACELDARDREKKLKQFGRVYSQLKRRVVRSLQGAQKVRG